MKDTVFYKLLRYPIKLLFFILYRPQIKGLENIPKEGKIIFAGNHTKWLDPVFLISSQKRQIHFLAKDELFHGKTKLFIKGMGCIPVNRKIHDKNALNQAIKCLENNLCVGIFPEGTINRTNDIIMPFKIGAVKMTQVTNATLIPFVITGKYKLFTKSIKIEFLKPIKVGKNLAIANEKLMTAIKNKLKGIKQ